MNSKTYASKVADIIKRELEKLDNPELASDMLGVLFGVMIPTLDQAMTYENARHHRDLEPKAMYLAALVLERVYRRTMKHTQAMSDEELIVMIRSARAMGDALFEHARDAVDGGESSPAKLWNIYDEPSFPMGHGDA